MNVPPLSAPPPLQPAGGFWQALDHLLAASAVEIDRPRGSRHPRYPGLLYPLDYGYLPGTQSMDGSGIDVWLGSLPERACQAVMVTIDLHKRDSEIKLLLGCTPEEEQTILAFLNDGAMRAHLLRRENDLPAPTRENDPPALNQEKDLLAPTRANDTPALFPENDLLSLIRARRSVRRFQDRPVPPELVEQLLSAAAWAPSAHHRQPWRFAVLAGLPARQSLARELGNAFAADLRADGLPPEQVAAAVQRSYARLTQAPLAILLCLDESTGDAYPDPLRQLAERLMGVQSVAMAGQNLLLAAHAMGLGGVWVCAPLFAPQAARAALDLPPNWQAQGIVLLGYPAKTPEARPRRPRNEITRYY